MSNAVDLYIGSLQECGRRFADAWHKAEHGELLDQTSITFHDLPALLAALTPTRLNLLRYVRHHHVRSVRALAAELHRDYKNVHQDVKELTRLGLLSRTHDQIVVPYAELTAKIIL